MKKQALSVILPALLAVAPLASATSKFSFDGFYTGIGIGGSFTNGRLNTTRSASFVIPGFSSSASSSVNTGLKGDSFTGDIYGGYGFSCWDPLYLSGEVYFKVGNSKARNSDTTNFSTTGGGVTSSGTIYSQTTAKLRTGEFGLDFRPGVFLTCNTLLYGRIGVAFNRVSLSSNATLTAQNSAFAGGPISAPFSQKATKNGGLRLGLGLEQEICANFTLRADYVYTQFRKVQLNNTAQASVTVPGAPGILPTFATATAKLANSSSARIFNHTVLLSVGYYW